MSKRVDLTGKKFHRLKVLGKAPGPPKADRFYYLCQCDCGKQTVCRGTHLKQGRIKSCGCIRKKLPVGITRNQAKNRYKALIGCRGEQIALGTYDTIEEAWQVRKYAEKLAKAGGSPDDIRYDPFLMQKKAMSRLSLAALTEDEVWNIRFYCAAHGRGGPTKMAKKYNLTIEAIRKICSGASYPQYPTDFLIENAVWVKEMMESIEEYEQYLLDKAGFRRLGR